MSTLIEKFGLFLLAGQLVQKTVCWHEERNYVSRGLSSNVKTTEEANEKRW